MKLHIQTRESCDREELRVLLIDAADEFAGDNHQVLEAKLPWDGHPALLADAQGQPVLVSFDPDNSQAALINGLAAVEQLSAALPWINQVYNALLDQQRPPRLVVVSRDAPPGTEAILASCPNLGLYAYKVLKINTDTGLWLDRLDKGGESGSSASFNESSALRPGPQIATALQTVTESLPDLTEEEESYFQQL